MNAADTTEDRVTMLHGLLNDAAKKVGQQRERIKKLEALLSDCAEYLEPYSDVSDGFDGPVPNRAMSLISAIEEEIA